MTDENHYSVDERELLLRHLAALRSDLIREFLRRHELSPLGERKEDSVERARQALRDGEIDWDDLIRYLDSVEPFGKQHVYIFSIAERSPLADLADAEKAEGIVKYAGLESLWQKRRPLAAPEQMRLGGISHEDGVVDVHAVARRSFRERRKDLEGRVMEGRPNLEARVYEIVYVRAWVRLRVDAGSQEASLHVSQLERKADYEGVRDEFFNLIASWFPASALVPINLARVVERLHEAEANGRPEATVQAVVYDSPVGVRSALSSATAGQSVLHQTDNLDAAASAMKDSGPGAAGNFYWLPSADGGLSLGNPLDDRVHVSVIARDHRVNIRRPVTEAALEYLIRRIRYLSS